MSRPLSPWAERFSEILNDGSRPAIFREEDLEHSGIAIDWPRKDPKYYNEADLGYFGEHILIPHDGTDIDRLLTSEQYQKGMFLGGRTWELASMNQHLWGSAEYRLFPGGHVPSDNPEEFRQAYERVRFTIDESKWFEFLQKFHWYDLFDDPNRPTRPTVPKGAPWSVDVPSIWEVLAPSIELVNRILRALINEQHSGLETLLFGRLVYWRNVASATNIAIPFDDALVLLSPQMELQVAAAENKAPYQNPLASVPEQFKSQAIEARLNQLCARHIWSVGPGDGWGWTQRRDGPTDWSLSFLSTQMLQHLREGKLTSAEIFILQFAVAIAVHDYLISR
ncbi:hypothetical protein ANO14919_140880 [Xylariales sp. No.14919]|nr:hypothetical protein ANO14919_140880 [Xylariales sp. No.14919]